MSKINREIIAKKETEIANMENLIGAVEAAAENGIDLYQVTKMLYDLHDRKIKVLDKFKAKVKVKGE